MAAALSSLKGPKHGGANIKVMQYLAGHSKAEITLNIYAHHIERSPEANLNTVLQAFPPPTISPAWS